jgi:hypothetical protein
MNTDSIQPLETASGHFDHLQAELEEARARLLSAEAELAEEQAAVNAFRMHCRLKLDSWIDTLLALQSEREALLTRLQLLRQAQEYGIPVGEAGQFWREEGSFDESSEADEEELILPTDTPRDKAAEKRLYRKLARKYHPDLGATAVEIAYRTEMMAAVNVAYEDRDVQTLYDLADQLDPQASQEISSIRPRRERGIREQILRCRLRTRKARRRLAALRRENTARLWRKARRLDRDDVHWWEIVRREIEQATDKVRADVTRLKPMVEALESAPDSAETG